MIDQKPDVTSTDYLAGHKDGYRAGKSQERKNLQDIMTRLAHEVKQGKHQKSALGILKEAWRRVGGDR